VEGAVSFYATVAGYIQYRTLAFLEAAVGRLQTGGWLDDCQHCGPTDASSSTVGSR